MCTARSGVGSSVLGGSRSSAGSAGETAVVMNSSDPHLVWASFAFEVAWNSSWMEIPGESRTGDSGAGTDDRPARHEIRGAWNDHSRGRELRPTTMGRHDTESSRSTSANECFLRPSDNDGLPGRVHSVSLNATKPHETPHFVQNNFQGFSELPRSLSSAKSQVRGVTFLSMSTSDEALLEYSAFADRVEYARVAVAGGLAGPTVRTPSRGTGQCPRPRGPLTRRGAIGLINTFAASGGRQHPVPEFATSGSPRACSSIGPRPFDVSHFTRHAPPFTIHPRGGWRVVGLVVIMSPRACSSIGPRPFDVSPFTRHAPPATPPPTRH